ncbi:hypothetical protein PGT21_001875 [Puccinia graminis f. sp. tritici]|uniref:Uncharacterized protein n=1 Tax=Puccinia graminis f. sp. tritici TaxID=56615 RepID=A0A5B0QZF2_PUCGR|nr:hypothetical protein PGT21_001875 [Puccinia graminis f. sp. tritici]
MDDIELNAVQLEVTCPKVCANLTRRVDLELRAVELEVESSCDDSATLCAFSPARLRLKFVAWTLRDSTSPSGLSSITLWNYLVGSDRVWKGKCAVNKAALR